MIITLTPNTGIDFTLKLSSFQLNSTIRFLDLPGGWAAKPRMYRGPWQAGRFHAGARFAAGPNGIAWKRCCASGVETDFTWVDGETR